jgi:hypothetical protein
VQDWIGFGSREEDSPLQRVQAHFHDPTKVWTQAGLPTGGESAILWSQDLNQDTDAGGGNHSWKDARDSYWRALTSTNQAERDQAWVETFETLGHLIHLVQDQATPSHTRLDPHPAVKIFGKYFGDPDRFHTWAESPDGLAMIDSSGSLKFDPAILNLSSNSLAPVPIARIIDTEALRTTGVPSEAFDIGVAEYSNANFFSDDTVFDSDYQAPTDLGVMDEPGPDGAMTRYLYRHPNQGSQYKLAVASALNTFVTLPFAQQKWAMDDFVMRDYGTKLFPRAIGYSAGLIDYFLRGQLEWDHFDGLGSGNPNCDPVDKVCAKVRNTSTEDTIGPGQIVAFVRCCRSSLSGQTIDFNMVSAPINISLTSEFQEIVFTLTSVPPPLQGADSWMGELFLIYKGPLGQEQGAVTTGGPCGNYNQVTLSPQFNHSFFGCEL